MKGLRLRRGSDRKFVPNEYVDVEAQQGSRFIDKGAESTSRSESSEILERLEDDSEEGSTTESSFG